ncbi:MAG: iron transporter [Patescibacteria group bacterium]|nr:MAG: iron transporter [Patescibacteria group bacterium]
MKKIKRFLKLLGPGFITGASDDDPSGIGTYSQTGAAFGYQQLWLVPFAFPLMTAVQEMCGRIGLVTGKGLAGVIRKYYSVKILYIAVFLLLFANTINIGANLGAMASVAEMLFGIPFIVWILVMTVITLLLEIFVSYRIYASFLKYLAFSIFSYIVAGFTIKQDWSAIFAATFVPSINLSREYLFNIVAVLGTTISPYLFFWQAGEEVEEEVETGKLRSMGVGIPHINMRSIKAMRQDTALGMFFSQLISFFIIVTTASTLYQNGINNVETAVQAAEALKPIAGDFAYLLFAIGIIGTGLLSVPVLAGSASYALSEAFGWKEGLYRKFTQAHGFYGVITVATIIGLLINFISVKPFTLLYYAAVLNGIVAPVLLLIIVLIANNSQIMGKYKNNFFSNLFGWMTVGIMFCASLGLIVSFLIFK